MYGGSLPRKLPRGGQPPLANHQASFSGFKYADSHELATATLRRGCLQPQRPTAAASLHSLPHAHHHVSYWTRPEIDQLHQQPRPDVLQQTDTDESAVESADSQQTDRHVIVNQLLTFLTEQQLKDESQLIDFQDSHCTPSTVSTLKLHR